MFSWFPDLDVRLEVALIGVGSALLTILLKDVVVHFWKEARASQKSATEVYRNYADPLLSASESFFWRLRETLTDTGRGAYLKSSGNESYFDRYKFESTLFRLAVLIGWVRAYRRELTFLSLSGGQKLEPLNDAICKFEAALADGAHVEVQRIKSLSELWSIPLPNEQKEVSKIGVLVEQQIKLAGPTEDGDQDLLINLGEAEQLSLCQSIADYMCGEARINAISSETVHKTRERAVRSLSIREAWLYRDFQSGIGDFMIKEVAGAKRRFDVVGFREFEALLYSDDSEIKRWVSRLNRVFNKLDISGADRFDARVQMLEGTFLATIDLILALTEIDKGRTRFAENTVSEAKRLKVDTSWRKDGG